MSSIQIPNLPVAIALTGSEQFEAVQAGSSVRVTVAQIATYSSVGTVTSVALSAPGVLIVGGSPITTAGTLALTLATQAANTIFAGPSSGSAVAPTFRAMASADLPTSAQIRTVPFSFVGTLINAQPYSLTMTQAGTLLANGGTPQSYVGINPTATQTMVLSTIHLGTPTTRGTITVSTLGVVTWPTFSNVVLTAGDTVQLTNQATADATFANACLSVQYQVT